MEASTFISCLPIDCYLTKFNKRGEMKPAPKPEATSNVSQDHLKPSKQSRDPRHKMDYAIFVIEEVYDARKAEQLGELLKQTLNELFDHYSLLSGVSQGEPNISSQSNPSKDENDELDLFAYSKCKYKRKRIESVFSEVQKEKQTEEMEDIETGFEDLSRNLVAPTFTILNFLLSAFEQ
ncbi:hypothetical protein V6N13_020473 [Hibiscus sabdariffa]